MRLISPISCINSLWRCAVHFVLGVSSLYEGYDNCNLRTPFENTEAFTVDNIVKQSTVLGPVLNNCSVNDNCAEVQGYIMGTVEVKALELVDDIADLSSWLENTAKISKIIVGIQERKHLLLKNLKY